MGIVLLLGLVALGAETRKSEDPNDQQLGNLLIAGGLVALATGG